MGFLLNRLKARFEEKKNDVLPGTIIMISGCEDDQTSADVSDVASFKLPDPAGRAGGACTATLLQVCYADHQKRDVDLSFSEVLMEMRGVLEGNGYAQIPQLSSSKPMDVDATFDLVPEESTGTRRALLIGINYIGHDSGVLSGCHNDVLNMVEYIKNVHGFSEENITILLDDESGDFQRPTKVNMLAAYAKIVAESESGDAIFCHYSGHGTKIRDDDNEEEGDGYDEALVPVDYNEGAGVLRDDELYDVLIRPLPQGTTMTCVMDCCHSGTVLDLPYVFKPNGLFEHGMEIDENFNFGKLFKKVGLGVDGLFDGDE